MSTIEDDPTVEYSDDEHSGVDQAEPERVVAGRYRLKELLGRGGMASVFKAVDESLGRTVAIKIFHTGLAHAQDARRQQDETSLLASLNHPNLVTLFDAATDGEDGFLVMEFIDGDDLRTRMQSGPLDSRSTALIGADIAGALAYIHSRGVVHRDVKPGNVLLAKAAGASNPVHAKLADFGIARLIDSTHLTAAGSLIGTASFLSPEQAGGGPVGPPSDVYSLALTLLECRTGERAFPGSAVESSIARINRDPTIPLDLEPEWIEVLRAATSRDPAGRPTAADLSRALRNLSETEATLVMPAAAAVADQPTQPLRPQSVDTEAVAPRPAATSSRVARTRTPPRKLIAAAAVAIVAIVVVIGLWSARPEPAPATDVEVIYPAVEGDLGTHLNQLQESVAP